MMKEIEPSDVEVKYEHYLEKNLGYYTIHCNIHASYIDEDVPSGEDDLVIVQLGTATIYMFDAEYVDGFLDIADSISGDCLSLMDNLITYCNDNECVFRGRLLLLDQFHIKQEYREQGLGKQALSIILDYLDIIIERDAIGVTSEPTQYSLDERGKNATPEYTKDKKRLHAFYQDFGFETIKENYLVRI